jgi:hypothetical protein
VDNAAKQKGMAVQKQKTKPDDHGIIKLPAYPFTAQILFRDIRIELSKQSTSPVSYELMSKIIGRARSTTYFWLDLYEHRNLLAFFSLLEWLPPEKRHALIDRHCREFPSLKHPRLARSPSTLLKLQRVLAWDPGLTFLIGGTDVSRTFILTALGHSFGRLRGQKVTGVDPHRPDNFVPVPSVFYLNRATGMTAVRKSILNIFPKILTSDARLLLVNGCWCSMPELQGDLIRISARKHVIVADLEVPDLETLKTRAPAAVRVITITNGNRESDRIKIRCRTF